LPYSLFCKTCDKSPAVSLLPLVKVPLGDYCNDMSGAFETIVKQISESDNRFDPSAYRLIRKALDFAIKEKQGKAQGKQSQPKHITGQEFLHSFRSYVIDQYGPMALTVLNAWGIHRCEDVGEVIFKLVEGGILGKTDEDKREDFAEVYDFHEAFVKPFLPQRTHRPSRFFFDDSIEG